MTRTQSPALASQLVFKGVLDVFSQYMNSRVLAIGCIAYANGLPLLLTSKTLGVWLKAYGLNYTSIGLFGLLHLPYSLKFLWAPFLDHVPLPYLKKHLGQRRSWLCVTQIGAILGLILMTYLDPTKNLKAFVGCSFLVTFSAASQHILLLTYQMESLKPENWGIGEGMSVFAFRMAILTGGAGALYLASFLSWQEVYLLLSSLMIFGFVAILIIKEPDSCPAPNSINFQSWRKRLSHPFIGPFKDFINQSGWLAILLFMLLYQLPENLLSMMQTLFLLDLGFTYVEISSVAKAFGLGATIFGSLIGGYTIRLYGYKHTLLWGGITHGLSCLLFLLQQKVGANLGFLYCTIGVEHFFSGVALTAFFSYQLTCCSLPFAATQLALLTSIAGLSGILTTPLAGVLVDGFGWTPYLLIVVLLSIPGIIWTRFIPYTLDPRG
ncbi:MAG: hypothetical protein ACD_16C00148G0002 [uncultured bacterium]|nr:MAG: hypothetical protein ACD_16C00148G0002 [uncultured bacterium]OFW69501.1 MAG: hypothetical protein A2X70_04110 [Alphaproteobacteria bacterium GWC2_42_16]OFW74236.1 MAG: hypothetical protein A2Z80_04950 [Alphaproteobacteria bacterium GWA2_41_27]OFW83230.1 MAG: hypothetical protein A3E50_01020 [Alphaproteobacteria bacterium RIFCSPHIGHO2_12_FULL_42_100]OFW86015.1 MAG: hypothetical protein A2W06_06845 [Alphaproteobacteria bacterium RBG_16_42_14]OFW92056.1 MAG: hypothetical protein A3C41_015